MRLYTNACRVSSSVAKQAPAATVVRSAQCGHRPKPAVGATNALVSIQPSKLYSPMCPPLATRYESSDGPELGGEGIEELKRMTTSQTATASQRPIPIAVPTA